MPTPEKKATAEEPKAPVEEPKAPVARRAEPAPEPCPAPEPEAPKARAKRDRRADEPVSSEALLERDGDVTILPKTPKEIAQQGTKIARAGSLDAGGNPPEDAPTGELPLVRIWALDTDVNTNRRVTDADPLRGDAVTSDPTLLGVR